MTKQEKKRFKELKALNKMRELTEEEQKEYCALSDKYKEAREVSNTEWLAMGLIAFLIIFIFL